MNENEKMNMKKNEHLISTLLESTVPYIHIYSFNYHV